MIEAEQGVIGCILIDNESLYTVYDVLKPKMFASEFCQEAYAEMLAMYDRGENINVISLSQALENHKWSPEMITVELKDCVVSAPTSVMIKNYADAIAKNYKARSVKELFQRVSLKPCDIDNTVAEVLARIEELQINKEVRSKSLKQIVKENKDNYFNDNAVKKGIKTGFYKLDDCL